MRLTAAPAAVASALLVGAVLPAGPARAADVSCLDISSDPTSRVDTDRSSRPLEQLHVDEAQQVLDDRGLEAGQGVKVAVLDSGVVDSPLLTVASHQRFGTSTKEVVYSHGSAVAGLIAGHERANGKPMGIAPAAEIVDVRVFDSDVPDTSAQPPEVKVSPDALADGLRWVADNAAAQKIKVANVSLAVAPSNALKEAIHAAWRAGVVVVAASGNRPQEGQLNYDRFAEYRPGEDAADAVFPAGYDHVVAANATVGGAGDVDLSDYVLQSSATDVAAPTAGAVSLAANGSTCLLPEVATSWSAAEVSGVVALLRSAYPHETPAQIVARLLDTADGTPGDPTSLRGAGVVQPVEALTRPLDADRHGSLRRMEPELDTTGRATAPEPRADVLAGTRDHAVWWGLLGGGALLLALLLRPVTARRRDPR